MYGIDLLHIDARRFGPRVRAAIGDRARYAIQSERRGTGHAAQQAETALGNVAFHSFGWGSRDENRNKPNFSLDFLQCVQRR